MRIEEQDPIERDRQRGNEIRQPERKFEPAADGDERFLPTGYTESARAGRVRGLKATVQENQKRRNDQE